VRRIITAVAVVQSSDSNEDLQVNQDIYPVFHKEPSLKDGSLYTFRNCPPMLDCGGIHPLRRSVP
jgi:hypothetical protein